MILCLLAAGEREQVLFDCFAALGWRPPSSSTLAYYRKAFAAEIAQARQRRIDEALTTGLALRAERIAALKDHAALLGAMRFTPDKNGRLWNERAWRQTLEDLALEMGDRKAKQEAGEQPVKVYIGFDPDKV